MTASLAPETEIIPGYIVRERLGAGGYGEVWKADAPGGLQKAVKMIYGFSSEERASRELKSLNLIKSLRHPFLLSLERFEIVHGKLVIVTELADGSLKDRYNECRAANQPGVVFEELIKYMSDAADALDYMFERHGLQHLDVKPENLLLVGGHVKVADFGLVKDVEDQSMSLMSGLTPVYAAPEVFNASPGRWSDQYSLGVLFQELLTGTLPFPGKTPAQLAAQHLNAKPALASLPEGLRSVVGRALAKDPAQRYPKIVDFVDALREASRKKPTKVAPQQSVETTNERSTDAYSEGSLVGDIRIPSRMLREADEAVAACAAGWTTETTCPAPVVVDAPPPHLPSEWSARPTLFVGLGNAGAIALQQLRARLEERLGPGAKCPAFQFLCVETDIHDAMRAQRGDDGAPLAADDVVVASLRLPQDYRDDREKTLQWLSRRWLYNIPRSLKTEGIRPLGRLAFVDHVKTIAAKMRQRVSRLIHPDAITASRAALKVDVSSAPRVVVVASISGGSGGMALDVANLARQLLDEAGVSDHNVLGVLVHATGRNPQQAELSRVNACAALQEIYSQSRPGAWYAGDPAAGLHARETNAAPFRTLYYVPLGDELNERQIHDGLDRVAEYLYRDAATALGAALDVSRKSCSASTAAGDALVRSFGVRQIDFDAGRVVSRSVERAICQLVDYWMDIEGASPESVKRAAEGSRLLLSESEVDADKIAARAQATIEEYLGGPLATVLHGLLAGDALAAALRTCDMTPIAHAIDRLIGPREQVKPDDPRFVAARRKLLQESDARAKQIASQLRQWTFAQYEEPAGRAQRAEAAIRAAIDRCTEVGAAARERLDQIGRSLAAIEGALGLAAIEGAKRATHSRRQPVELERALWSYCDERVQELAWRQAAEFAAAVKRGLSTTADQTVDLRRELKAFRSQFFAGGEEPNDAAATNATPSQPGFDGRLASTLEAVCRETRAATVARLSTEFEKGRVASGESFPETLFRTGEARQQLLDWLRRAAKASIREDLSKVDLAELLWSMGGDALSQALSSARPRAIGQGVGQWLAVVSKRSPLAAAPDRFAAGFTAAKERHGATLTLDADDSLTLVRETYQTPLAQIAWGLIDGRPDLLDCAERVRTRIDVSIAGFAPLN